MGASSIQVAESTVLRENLGEQKQREIFHIIPEVFSIVQFKRKRKDWKQRFEPYHLSSLFLSDSLRLFKVDGIILDYVSFLYIFGPFLAILGESMLIHLLESLKNGESRMRCCVWTCGRRFEFEFET